MKLSSVLPLTVLCTAVVKAQVSPSTAACPSIIHQPDASLPHVTVAELSTEGAFSMPPELQDQIAASLKRRAYCGRTYEVGAAVAERVRDAWQQLGYFRAEANAEADILTSNPVDQRVAVSVHLNEGQRYRLGQIVFNNVRIAKPDVLRALWSMKDGGRV